MKRLMFSTWRWDRAIGVAYGLAGDYQLSNLGKRYAVEASKVEFDGGQRWRWHVYRVR